MGQKGVVFTTSLSLKDCANIFRHAAQSSRGAKAKMVEMGARAAGNHDAVGFYTPRFDSPFAAVDGVPDFAIGFNVIKFMGGARGNGTHVHMYVDEKGSTRDVQLISSHGLTGGMRSGRVVSAFFEHFQAADPRLRVTDGNV